MRDLVAPLTRRFSGPGRDGLVLEADSRVAGAWRVLRRRRGASAPVATLSVDAPDAAWRHALASRRRNEPVVIALGEPFLFRRTTVPAAAAANLGRFLRYEMDRLTPFAAADVLFTYRAGPRDATGVLRVDLAIVPRAWVQDPLERLAALSIRPDALEAPDMGADEPVTGADPELGLRRIPLDYSDEISRARVRLAWTAGMGVCAVLAAAAVILPFARQAMSLAELEARIAQLRPSMSQVDALRGKIASGSAGAGQFAAARQRGTAALRILGVLTDLLPDDTFLVSLSLRRDQLTMQGHSASATKLIASMATVPQLKNPSFAAPVLRGDNGKDVFTIQAGFGS